MQTDYNEDDHWWCGERSKRKCVLLNTSPHTLCWREPSNWICTYFISRESQNRRRAGLTTPILFHKRSKHFSRDDIQMLQYHHHHIYVFKIRKIMASNWVFISYLILLLAQNYKFVQTIAQSTWRLPAFQTIFFKLSLDALCWFSTHMYNICNIFVFVLELSRQGIVP